MATITRTIPDAVVPRVFAAFNARFRGRDVVLTNVQIVNKAIDAFVMSIVSDYEAGLAAQAADAQARIDITIS